MSAVCTCPREQLCDACLAQARAWHIGLARARGEWWAEDVARRTGTARPWPPHEGHPAAIARSKVAELTADPRLLELLAAEVARFAARRWGQLRAGA